MGERIIVTVMGKALKPGGKASEELVDRCTVASKVMKERHGALVIPTGKEHLRSGLEPLKERVNNNSC